MAIVAVKASKNSTGSGTTATITGLTATASNALFVGGGSFTGTVSGSAYTVTRTGDTYTTNTEGSYPSGVNRNHIGIASAPNVVAGGADCTLSITNGGGVSVFAMEFSGLPSSGLSDAASPAVATGSSAAATSNALTNVTPDALYIGVCGSGSGSVAATMTAGSGFTDTIGGVTATVTNGSTNQVAGMAYLIVASTASRTVSWTVDNAEWTAAIAVYKAAGGAAIVRPKPPRVVGVALRGPI